METNKEVSNRQEKNVAKVLGGHKTANSGATAFSKGDVIVKNCIIECKTKTKEVDSFTVQKAWIKELNEEKISMGKALSALAISFDCGKSSYYVIDEKAMKLLLSVVNDEVI